MLPYFEKLNRGLDLPAVQVLLELGALLETAHPNDPKTWSLSGDLLYHTDQIDAALSRYRSCIKLNPTVFSVGENTLAILNEQNNYGDLLQTAEQAMDAFPNQATAYYYFGIAAREKGDADEAIRQLQQATLMAGNNLPLRLDISDQIGLALLSKRAFAEAKVHYEKILDKGGKQTPPHSGTLWRCALPNRSAR